MPLPDSIPSLFEFLSVIRSRLKPIGNIAVFLTTMSEGFDLFRLHYECIWIIGNVVYYYPIIAHELF